MSLPAWGEWIEIPSQPPQRPRLASLPAWGEWIEISLLWQIGQHASVSPRMGRVD